MRPQVAQHRVVLVLAAARSPEISSDHLRRAKVRAKVVLTRWARLPGRARRPARASSNEAGAGFAPVWSRIAAASRASIRTIEPAAASTSFDWVSGAAPLYRSQVWDVLHACPVDECEGRWLPDMSAWEMGLRQDNRIFFAAFLECLDTSEYTDTVFRRVKTKLESGRRCRGDVAPPLRRHLRLLGRRSPARLP